ncbi:hypothetical protein ES708_02262 [subsurface metagenome]
MPHKCEYCGISEGQIDRHHPIDLVPEVGIYLCQRHHSLLYGRKELYPGETRELMEADRQKIRLLVKRRVARAIQQLAYYLAEEKFKG